MTETAEIGENKQGLCGWALKNQAAWSMAWGALALICYSWAVCQVLMRLRWRALAATIACLALWIVVAFSLEWLSGAMS